jgi:purine-nucleoside phosphorylase
MVTSLYDRAEVSARYIREHATRKIDVAVVLGSGLGAFAEVLSDRTVVPYEDIPDFARSTVEGHSGRLVIGSLPETDINVGVMQGRFHYYEGYSLDEVTLPIRAFHALGVERLILTNAAGGVNDAFTEGSLMLITDHINLMMISPLRGQHDDRLGNRFPDMTEVYSRSFQEIARSSAARIGLPLNEGIYLALQGPNYETPAEIRMMRILGADAVGMSTVPEAIVARQMGMKTIGISVITNAAAGITNGPIEHAEVMKIGERVSRELCQLLSEIIPQMVAK